MKLSIYTYIPIPIETDIVNYFIQMIDRIVLDQRAIRVPLLSHYP